MKVRIKDEIKRICQFFPVLSWSIAQSFIQLDHAIRSHCSFLWRSDTSVELVLVKWHRMKVLLHSVISGVDLTCSHSADFGANARVEWKFKNMLGSQVYVVFNGKPTGSWTRLSFLNCCGPFWWLCKFFWIVFSDPYSSRLTVYGNNLRFSKVTRKDTGLYDCEVSGNSQFGEARVTLTVLGKNLCITFRWLVFMCTIAYPAVIAWIITILVWTLYCTVPPSPPVCKIPSSVTTGKAATLTCHDADGSPPPTYKWYKNNVPLPADPSTVSGYQNATYKMDINSGSLVRGEHLSAPAEVLNRWRVFKGALSFRRTPEHPSQTLGSTTAKLWTRPAPLSAAESPEWKSVSAPPCHRLKTKGP